MAKRIPFKVLTTAAVAATVGAAAFVPAAVANSEASFSISEVVVEKDGKNFSLALDTYLLMKGADHEFVTKEDGGFINPSFVKSSTGKVFKLTDFISARGATDDGAIEAALELLDANEELAQEVVAGSVTVGADGELDIKDPVVDPDPGVDPDPDPVTELAVESVMAINGTDLEGMPGNSDIVIEFNQKVDLESLKEGLLVEDEDGAVAVSVTLDGNKATIKFAAPLQSATEYTLSLKDVKVADGETVLESFEKVFTTGTFLLVERVSAGAGGAGDAFESGKVFDTSDLIDELHIDFDLAVNQDTVTSSNVRLYNVTDKTYVPLTLTLINENQTLKIERAVTAVFASDKAYRLEIKNLESLSGVKLAEEMNIKFAVGDEPTIDAVTDLNGVDFETATTTVGDITFVDQLVYGSTETAIFADENNDTLAQIGFSTQVRFAQKMDPATVNNETIYLEEIETGDKAKINVTYNNTANIATITLQENLKEATAYKLVVSEEVLTPVGIGMDEAEEYFFYTKPLTPVTVASVTPRNRAAGVSVDNPIEVVFSHDLLITDGETPMTLASLDITLNNLTDEADDISFTIDFKEDEDGDPIYNIIEITPNDSDWTQGKRYELVINGITEPGVDETEIPQYIAAVKASDSVVIVDDKELTNFLNDTFKTTFTTAAGQDLSLVRVSNELEDKGEFADKRLKNPIDLSKVNNDLADGSKVYFEFARALKEHVGTGSGEYNLYNKITFEKLVPGATSWVDATSDFVTLDSTNVKIGAAADGDLANKFLELTITDSSADDKNLFRVKISKNLEDNQGNKLGEDKYMYFNLENASLAVGSIEVGYYDADAVTKFDDTTDISNNNAFNVTDGGDGLNAIQFTVHDGTATIASNRLEGLTSENIYVTDDEGNKLTGKIVVMEDAGDGNKKSLFTLVLDEKLKAKTDYQVFINDVRFKFTQGGKTYLAHTLDADESNFAFGTGDLTKAAVTVVSTNFAANSIQATDKVFTFELSEARSKAEVESAISLFVRDSESDVVDVDVKVNGTTVTVTPVGYLKASERYTFKVEGDGLLVNDTDFVRHFTASSTQKTPGVNNVTYQKAGDNLVIQLTFDRELVTAANTAKSNDTSFTLTGAELHVFGQDTGLTISDAVYNKNNKRLTVTVEDFYADGEIGAIFPGDTELVLQSVAGLAVQIGHDTIATPKGNDKFDIEVSFNQAVNGSESSVSTQPATTVTAGANFTFQVTVKDVNGVGITGLNAGAFDIDDSDVDVVSVNHVGAGVYTVTANSTVADNYDGTDVKVNTVTVGAITTLTVEPAAVDASESSATSTDHGQDAGADGTATIALTVRDQFQNVIATTEYNAETVELAFGATIHGVTAGTRQSVTAWNGVTDVTASISVTNITFNPAADITGPATTVDVWVNGVKIAEDVAFEVTGN